MKTGILHRASVHILLISVLGLCIYSNTFNSEFVLDDKPYIVHNPAIKDMAYFLEPSKVLELDEISPNFRYAFFTRPAGYVTFALNYHLHGLDVAGYHVFNLLVHIINGFLVYFLIRVIFRTPFFADAGPDDGRMAYVPADMIALFSALVFVSHPVQTQAVTYVTQRFASLATLFFLLSVYAYIRSRLSGAGGKRSGFYGLSLVSAVLAMMVKEISFTLPFIIALAELMFFTGDLRKRVVLLVPIAFTMLVIPSSLFMTTGSYGISGFDRAMKTLAASPEISRWEYLITQAGVIVTYIRLLLMPVNQNIDYDYPVFHSIFNPTVLFSLAVLFTLFALAVYFLRRSRMKGVRGGHLCGLIAFGILWFFITLSVESSIIPIDDVIFEHRLYLPSAGFILAAAAAVGMMAHAVRSRTAVNVMASLAVLAVFVLGGAAYARNNTWKDNITVWEDAAEKSPLKDRPHFNLGVAYTVRGRLDDAIREYRKTIQINPGHVKAHNNLGLAYASRGNTGDAVEEYLTAIRIDPDYAEAHYNLGLAYAARGRNGEAVGKYLEAVRIDPDYFEAHINLGVAYYTLGRIEEAVNKYREAIRINPSFAVAHYNLGLAYDSLGRTSDAVREYMAAVRIKPDFREAHYRLGMANKRTY